MSTKMNVHCEPIGKTQDGEAVDQYTLTNAHGLKVRLMTYGATMTKVEVPDRRGKLANVTLNLDTLQDYLAGHPFLGPVAGRYANRIAGAKFTLDGREYPLVANSGVNQLHGGKKGFDKYVWQAQPVQGHDFVGAQLTLVSPDGDQGFPGTLTAAVTYTLHNSDELKMEYVARTDKPTPVNLTNHAYWNLAGAGSGDVLGHVVMLNADRYLPVGEGLIPTGEIRSVTGTPMDFTRPMTIGSRIDQVPPGYDHCYVINQREGEEIALAARVVEPASGRVMEIHTSQPGVQFYTANFLSDKFKAGGRPYAKHDGFCLETQHFPDSPNRPQFPSTILRPGQTFHQVTIHRFRVEP